MLEHLLLACLELVVILERLSHRTPSLRAVTTRFRAIRIGFLPKWDNCHEQPAIHSDLFDIDKKKNEKVEKRSPFEVNECIINFDES